MVYPWPKPPCDSASRRSSWKGRPTSSPATRHSVTHAVGTLGTALTPNPTQRPGLLKGLVKEVVLVFDGDAAGGAATERSIGLFLDAGLRVRVVTLPEREDPDSFLRQHTAEEFLRYVDEAVSFVDYLLTPCGAVF